MNLIKKPFDHSNINAENCICQLRNGALVVIRYIEYQYPISCPVVGHILNPDSTAGQWLQWEFSGFRKEGEHNPTDILYQLFPDNSGDDNDAA